MSRVKTRRGKQAVQAQDEAAVLHELAELHGLQHRLEELLLACERIGLSLGSNMTIEVWGQLRAAPHLGWLRLAVGHDLRSAVAGALREAGQVQGPHLKTITREMIIEATRALREGNGRERQAHDGA